MAPPLLLLTAIELGFGGDPLLDGAELSVSAGERLCLVGRNGSGKSTLLKIAAGLVESDDGERFLQPGTTVRYLQQEPDLTGYATARAYTEAGLGPGDDPYRAQYLLEHLGLTGDEDPSILSGGEKRRAALARAIAPEPDILLLDEPTNHLDLPAIEWLEAELKQNRAALVLISHDRQFLDVLSNNVVWLDRGRTQRLDKGFHAFETWRDEILEHETTTRHKLDRKIVRETHWLNRGVTARRKRNMGRLRALQNLRKERREQRQVVGNVKIATNQTAASGKRVIEAKGLTKSFGEKTVVRDFSARILRGDRVGIIGPNGAGKTTLLNMLTGTLAPDTGTIKLGTTLELATLEQSRSSLTANMSLQDALTGGSGDSVTVGGEQRHVIGYMKDFLFAPEQARTAISALSGGERGRLMLARALTRPANLLVLDEPTNDLDLETLDLLQEMLADFAGTVLLVSHDRDFLDRVVTSVIHFEGDGNWIEYAGGYTDMLSQRGSNSEAPANKSGKPAKVGRQDSRSPSSKRPGKLSYKDKHALETLPARMVDLETEIATLQDTLTNPDLFTRDPAAFERTTLRLQVASVELDAAEEKWLQLELLREELQSV
jgi:ABC transport system ATP-binding/permease protein